MQDTLAGVLIWRSTGGEEEEEVRRRGSMMSTCRTIRAKVMQYWTVTFCFSAPLPISTSHCLEIVGSRPKGQTTRGD